MYSAISSRQRPSPVPAQVPPMSAWISGFAELSAVGRPSVSRTMKFFWQETVSGLW